MADKAPEPEPQALVVPDYGTNPDTMAARGPTSMGSELAQTPRASAGGGGSDLAAKLEVVTVNPDPNAIDKATAAESARLQTNLYNATFWLCVVEAIRMLIQAFVLGTQGVFDIVKEVYYLAGVFAFGYLGAKHRDSGVILASVISQGICLLWFLYCSYLLADQWLNKEPLSSSEMAACVADPMCDEDTINGTHRLSFTIPLVLMNVFWVIGMYHAWKLYEHRSSNSELRASDTGQTTVGGTGGSLPVPLLVRVNADPTAKDEVAAASGAKLQTITYNLLFWVGVMEVLRQLVKVLLLNTVGWMGGIADCYLYLTPIALGYVGAKHRDEAALAAFTISSAVCFLFFFTVTYTLVVELWYYGVPMTDEEKSICQKDPECDLATERAYVTHPLDSIPLFALQVLFGVSTYYGVQLWRHPTTNSDMRNIPI